MQPAEKEARLIINEQKQNTWKVRRTEPIG